MEWEVELLCKMRKKLFFKKNNSFFKREKKLIQEVEISISVPVPRRQGQVSFAQLGKYRLVSAQMMWRRNRNEGGEAFILG